MTKAWDKYTAASATLIAAGNLEGAELLKARYTISRCKAVCFGDLPGGWGMGLGEAHQIVNSFVAARAASKAAKEATKEARRVAREAAKEVKMAGKKRARE